MLLKNFRRQLILSANERTVWRWMLAGMIALGINKQLDLQSGLTELARVLAHEQGWYANRRQYQEAFVVASPMLGLTAMAALVLLIWRAPAPTLCACAGAVGLLIFIAIRAASFHRVDEMLGLRLSGLSMNWLLEIGSLLVIGCSAYKRYRVRL